MPADFLATPCKKADCHCIVEPLPGRICKNATQNNRFGLCDDIGPDQDLPAYIQVYQDEDWVGIVLNPQCKKITFKAIDNCVDIRRPNGELEQRCDGLLIYDNSLKFIELKHRESDGWLAGAINQLVTTIEKFAANHDINTYDNVNAQICNGQYPYAVAGTMEEQQRFRDQTLHVRGGHGLNLTIDRTVRV